MDMNNPAEPGPGQPGDAALILAIQGGLPLVERPFAAIAAELGLEEGAVIARIQALMAAGAIKRLGVIVRHQELGYGANAMVVWDLPDAGVDALGQRIGQRPYVTLCYRRPRCLPAWPYNLFTMIHGRDRAAVLAQVEAIKQDFDLGSVPSAVLFSGQRFKQRGAYYQPEALADARPTTDPLRATAMNPPRARQPGGRPLPVPVLNPAWEIALRPALGPWPVRASEAPA
jgi:DNA-binding Lrp family transcriptional regulator